MNSTTYPMIPLARIQPSRTNPRKTFKEAGLLELQESITKPDRDTQVLQLSKAGLSLNQIAVEVGVSRTTVFNIINAERRGKTQ